MHSEPRVTPAHRTSGPFLLSLSPSAPHTKGVGAPSLVPKVPFLSWERVVMSILSAVAATLVFYPPELIQHCLLIALGSIPTQHDQHLHICSFICRPAHGNICFPPLLMFFIHLKPLCIHVWSLCCVWWVSRPRLAHQSAWWRPFVGQPDSLLSGHGEGLGYWDLLDFSVVM